jgi:glucosamine kinase
MLLIADSGGTSTSWALVHNGSVTLFFGQGLHPDVINSDTKLPKELLKNRNNIKRVVFYGTGCATDEKANKVYKFLLSEIPTASVEVYSDLLALAHPFFNKRKGLVAVLGTGSSMAYYDGENLNFEVISPGKGFDPGSGPVIGQMVFQKLKNQNLGKDTINLFDGVLLHNDYDDNILNQINKILFENLNNPECSGILKDAFLEYFEFYRPLWSKHYYPIVFGGTVAELGKGVLINVMKRKGIQLEAVVRYPIEILTNHYLRLEIK